MAKEKANGKPDSDDTRSSSEETESELEIPNSVKKPSTSERGGLPSESSDDSSSEESKSEPEPEPEPPKFVNKRATSKTPVPPVTKPESGSEEANNGKRKKPASTSSRKKRPAEAEEKEKDKVAEPKTPLKKKDSIKEEKKLLIEELEGYVKYQKAKAERAKHLLKRVLMSEKRNQNPRSPTRSRNQANNGKRKKPASTSARKKRPAEAEEKKEKVAEPKTPLKKKDSIKEEKKLLIEELEGYVKYQKAKAALAKHLLKGVLMSE